MSREKDMNAASESLSEIQQRAAWYVDRATFGRHQDKRLAEMLRVSPNMAYRLKKGEGWTVERLGVAAQRFGWTFIQCVFGPVAGQRGGFDVTEQIADLRKRVDTLAASVASGPLPDRAGDMAAGRYLPRHHDAAADRGRMAGQPPAQDAAFEVKKAAE